MNDEFARIRAAFDVGRLDEALRLAVEGIANSPGDATWHRFAAMTQFRRHEYNEAARHASASLALDPHSEHAWRILAFAELMRANISAATQAADRAIESDPTVAEAWYVRGRCALHASDYGGCERFAAECERLEPDSAMGDELRGRSALTRELSADAERWFRRALEKRPDRASYMNDLGRSLLDQGRNAEAADIFERAARMDASDSTARENAAIAGRAHVTVGSGKVAERSRGMTLPFIVAFFLARAVFKAARIDDTFAWVAIGVSALLVAGWFGLRAQRNRELSVGVRRSMAISRRTDRSLWIRPHRWTGAMWGVAGLIVLGGGGLVALSGMLDNEPGTPWVSIPTLPPDFTIPAFATSTPGDASLESLFPGGMGELPDIVVPADWNRLDAGVGEDGTLALLRDPNSSNAEIRVTGSACTCDLIVTEIALRSRLTSEGIEVSSVDVSLEPRVMQFRWAGTRDSIRIDGVTLVFPYRVDEIALVELTMSSDDAELRQSVLNSAMLIPADGA